jgi:hypothetical protein
MTKHGPEGTTCAVMTIGHSTGTLETFIHLLQVHGVKQVVDVRMTPFAKVSGTHLVYPPEKTLMPQS